MKAFCENDATRGRGYARFCCDEVNNLETQYSFSLCRASDQTFLARTGWQNGEEQHSPEGQHVEGSRLILTVGPNIVDSLDENENYRLTLHTPGSPPQRAAFSIAQINRSLRGAAGSLQMPAAVAATAPLAEPEPQPPLPPLEEPIAAPTPQPSKNTLPLVLAVLLVLALAGGGLWWFMQSKNKASEQAPITEEIKPAENPAEKPVEPAEKKDDTAKTEPKPAESKPEVKPEPKPEPAPAPAKEAPAEEVKPAPAPAPPTPLAPRDRVRQYLGGSPSTPGAMDMARDMLTAPEGSTPETQDSVYRLYYYAKQQGDADAALGLARSADPTQAPWGSLPKNAAEAWALYAVAAPQKPEAAKAMMGLKQWLETEGGKGNSQAIIWIEEIARASKAQ